MAKVVKDWAKQRDPENSVRSAATRRSNDSSTWSSPAMSKRSG